MKEIYTNIGATVGHLVQEKNEAYGSSFERSQEVLKILYPNGVQPSQYKDMLAITRVVDKLFRIANRKDAFGENPWQDIAGYGILGTANELEEKEETVRDQQELQFS